MLRQLLLSLILCFSRSLAADNSSLSYDVFQYVDPLIGSANGGKHLYFDLPLASWFLTL